MDALPSVEQVFAKLNDLGVNVPAGHLSVDGYCNSAQMSQALLALIRSGHKRAGMSLLWAIEAENDRVPQVGVLPWW